MFYTKAMHYRLSLDYLKQPRPATHGLILSFALAKLALAPWLPLAAHEAHYALYGYYLDFSYVDHPPLVGWLQALVLQVADNEWALRIIPITLSTLTQYLLAALTIRLYPQQSPWLGFLSVLLLQGTLILHLAIGMVPEVPLAFLSVLAVWFAHRSLIHNGWRDWLALGLVLGLAGLAKYTAITLAVSVLLALLLAGQGRLLLKSKPWVAALLALLLVTPVIIWNWQRDWLSFVFQLGYQMDSNPAGTWWSLRQALGFQLEQMIVYSPLIYFGGLMAIVWSLRHGDDSSRLLLVFSLPILLLFVVIAGLTNTARSHWTFIGWLILTPLIARWLVAHWQRRSVRGLTYVSAFYSAFLVLLLHLLVLPVGHFPDFVHPMKKLVGWKAAAVKAESLRRTLAPADSQGRTPVLMVKNWHHASQLAWYTRPNPVFEVRGRLSQYAYWFGRLSPGMEGILVIPSDESNPPANPSPGLDCMLLAKQPAYHGSSLTTVFYFYRCRSS